MIEDLSAEDEMSARITYNGFGLKKVRHLFIVICTVQLLTLT